MPTNETRCAVFRSRWLDQFVAEDQHIAQGEEHVPEHHGNPTENHDETLSFTCGYVSPLPLETIVEALSEAVCSYHECR